MAIFNIPISNMYDKYYGGVIWTKHALKRLRERGIKQGDAWASFNRPDSSEYATTKQAYVYYKTWGNTKIEVVAKQDKEKKWIILSVWSSEVNKKDSAKYFGNSILGKLLGKIFKS